MLDVISHLPAQPLFIAGVACATTFVVMQYGLGTVVQSVQSFVARPIIKPVAIIASGLVGLQILRYFLSTELLLLVGAGIMLYSAVIKYGPGTVARSIGATVFHPLVGVLAGIAIGIVIGLECGLELVTYLYRHKPALFNELHAFLTYR